jgi:hypothetical protein
MIRLLGIVLTAILLVSCQEYTEVERETGYKGKARVNPWLAAEKFAVRMGYETKSVISWTAPEWGEAVWIMPATALNNESFTRRTNNWVQEGGHLILLLDWADSETSDWARYSLPPETMPPLVRMLESARIHIDDDRPAKADHVDFRGRTYKVSADSRLSVADKKDGDPGVFVSRKSGDGRISVIADGRIFRNRWIGDEEHAELLNALIESTGREGAIGLMRASGLSLWEMLRKHLWPVLLGLAVWIVLWLWKNLSRFGPVESANVPSVLRGYEHHLEALGDFQWRIDKGASLLAPLREQIVELGQRTSHRAGRRDDDFFQYLAERAGLPRERVFRALAEAAPADAAVLTRTTADLQQILKVLHNPVNS